MIASLKGKIERIFGNHIELDVNNVGYLVFVGLGFLKRHQTGEELKIQTYMAVSENDMALYGFETTEELDLFKMLITVSGVGPKTAAQILGTAFANASASQAIVKAIGEADVDFFKKIKGIGLKTAQRIIVDLKSKINKQDLDMTAFAEGFGESKDDDLTLSLRQLGFEKKEIDNVIKKMPAHLSTTEEKLEWSLLNLGK